MRDTNSSHKNTLPEPAWPIRFKQLVAETISNQQHEQSKTRGRKKPKWTIIVGLKNSGKKNLLQKLGCKTITQQEGSQTIIPFDIWYNKYECFLVTNEETSKQQETYSIWKTAVSTINKTTILKSIWRILLIIDTPTLCQNNHDQMAFDIKNQVQKQISLIHEQQKLQIHIAINKCDYIIGYKEYFHAGLSQHSNELFGINTTPTNKHLFYNSFNEQKNSLLQHVTKNIFNLLQKQHDHKQRKDISQFPIQLDLLLTRVKKIISLLSDTTTQHITRITMHAYEQQEETINILSSYLNTIIDPLQTTKSTVGYTDRALHLDPEKFSDYRQTGIIQTYSQKYIKHDRSINKTVLTIFISAIAGILIVNLYHRQLTNNLNNTENLLHKINNEQLHSPSITTNYKWLNELQRTQEVMISIENSNTLKYKWIGTGASNHIYKETLNQYQLLLSKYFQPYILSILTNKLHDKHSDAISLYNALKIYLMLTQNTNYDQHQIITWFNKQWGGSTENKDTTKILKQQLSYLLSTHHQPWPSDKQLISQTRDKLAAMPPPIIAMLKIWNNSSHEKILITNKKYPYLNSDSLKIDSIFAHESYKEIMSYSNKDIINILNQHDWVISKNTDISTKPKELAIATQDIYKQESHKAWDNLVNNIEFKEANNIDELDQLINQISNKNSSLYSLIKSIQQYTSPQTKNAIANLITNSQDQIPWQQPLKRLETQLQTFNGDKNPAQAMFIYTKTFFQDQAIGGAANELSLSAPNIQQPIQSGIKTIINSYWKIMFAQTNKYLNTKWQQLILAPYNKNIKNKFPISKDASNDITINNFNDFFGPNGAVNSFFNNYLDQFINTDKQTWSWKKIDGRSVALKQDTLDMMILASTIQQMFYANQTDKPNTEFALAYKSLADDMLSAQFNISGQELNFDRDDKTIKQASFPQSGDTNNTSGLTITYKDHTTHDISTKGAWSWLRLVNTASLLPTPDANQFIITFKAKKNTASFGLVTPSAINPYLANTLYEFKLPKDIK